MVLAGLVPRAFLLRPSACRTALRAQGAPRPTARQRPRACRGPRRSQGNVSHHASLHSSTHSSPHPPFVYAHNVGAGAEHDEWDVLLFLLGLTWLARAASGPPVSKTTGVGMRNVLGRLRRGGRRTPPDLSRRASRTGAEARARAARRRRRGVGLPTFSRPAVAHIAHLQPLRCMAVKCHHDARNQSGRTRLAGSKRSARRLRGPTKPRLRRSATKLLEPGRRKASGRVLTFMAVRLSSRTHTLRGGRDV